MKNAVTTGMLPDIDLSLFSYIGNSSLSGAYAMRTSDQADLYHERALRHDGSAGGVGTSNHV